ncbi:carbohydrate kinase [Shewanella submarina]|uniref:Carbohydrate kinase n=1 Tax=Shewanella submarina TaxID=2016376 RepID=A0ABV7GBN9_9GAMM|nr:carbohydrate kinase [Shewanella submarina]MCL1036814.1 carbohydrate kinase [Shewanella submarina]
MKEVLCFGEALIDFLNTGKTEQDGLTLNEFRQYPGGAPANAAVAIAKLGGKARFAGQVGNDGFGRFLGEALNHYGVDTQALLCHPRAKTALAFVTLDEEGERSFAFYRDQSADMVLKPEQVSPQWFSNQPIVHFCSNTLTTSEIAESTRQFVQLAKHQGCLVSFDVNLRHNLWPAGKADIKRVNELVLSANLLKFSREEFEYLAGDEPQRFIKQCFQGNCRLLMITDGGKELEYFTPDTSGIIYPPRVTTVDTTAGGDGFIGGLLFALAAEPEPQDALQTKLIELLTFACHCGALAVTRPGAFPALAVLNEIQQALSGNETVSSLTALRNQQ